MSDALAVAVDCYAGHRGDETPRRFTRGDQLIEILAVVHRGIGFAGYHDGVSRQSGPSASVRLRPFCSLGACRRRRTRRNRPNHHQRAALDDAWERTRLRHLKPDVTDADLTELLRGRFYAHILPTYRQAKLTTWDMAKYFAAPIPGVTFNEAELRIDYPNGSKLQLFGSDKPDRLRGLAFSGVSFDEYGMHPLRIPDDLEHGFRANVNTNSGNLNSDSGDVEHGFRDVEHRFRGT